jgi:gamma-glutamylcyclotransferase
VEFYFAYGSNMDEDQMERRCIDKRFLSIGYLPHHRLAFTQYYEPWGGGVADVIENSDSIVWGKVYELSTDALERLDKYEGHPTDYIRTEHDIVTPNGQLYSAWIYSVVIKEGDCIAPSKRYMSVLTKAAKQAGLPNEYLLFLSSIRTVDD